MWGTTEPSLSPYKHFFTQINTKARQKRTTLMCSGDGPVAGTKQKVCVFVGVSGGAIQTSCGWRSHLVAAGGQGQRKKCCFQLAAGQQHWILPDTTHLFAPLLWLLPCLFTRLWVERGLSKRPIHTHIHTHSTHTTVTWKRPRVARLSQQRYGLQPGGQRGLRMTHGSLAQRPYSLDSLLINQIYCRSVTSTLKWILYFAG